jgi:hypothetical protein
MRWTALLQRHRNVPISNSDGTAASALLAFSERPESAAKSSRQRTSSITTGFGVTTDEIGRKADAEGLEITVA